MAAYLDGKEPDEATLKRLIRKAVITGAFYPVLCGSAFKNKGVQPLLDAVVDYLPSPLDVPPIKGIDDKGNEVVRKPDDNEPLSLLAFKIMDDPFVGTITFCRIYSGTLDERHRRHQLDQGAQGARRPHAADARQQPRGHQGSLCRRHRRARRPEGSAHRRHAVRSAEAGDPGEDGIPRAGHRDRDRAEVEGRPGEARRRAGEARGRGSVVPRLDRSGDAARPSSRGWASCISTSRSTSSSAPTRSKPISARRRSPIARRSRAPVTESTTPTRSRPAARASSRRSRSSLEPLPPGTGFEFENKIVGGTVPKEYIPGVEKGLEVGARRGRARRLPGGRPQGAR